MTSPRVLRHALVIWALIPWTAGVVSAETITFESISSGTFVRDQFQGLGIRVSGTGPFSGLVYSEGAFGTANYGNSPTQIVDVGNRGEPTTIQFVDPANPSVIIGARAVSVLIGDGDVDSETFAVTYFDVSGGVLSGPVEYTTTSSGLRLSETSTSLGALIGSVRLMVVPGSASGVTFDDLEFTLATSAPCVYSFGSGSGSSLVRYCVSANGTIVEIQSPAGQEHLAVGEVLEGYVICTGTTVHAWDLSSDADGFGATTVIKPPNATSVTLRRSSAQYQLDQVFKLDKAEKEMTITVTVTNISGAMIPDVRLTRAYDPDPNGDFGDDLETKSARSVWASDSDGVTLAGSTWTMSTDTAVDTGVSPACSATGAPSPLLTGDASLATVTYRLGNMAAGAKKKVVFVYRVQ
jgi:hypothetical protein